jgi:hypothetical protein
LAGEKRVSSHLEINQDMHFSKFQFQKEGFQAIFLKKSSAIFAWQASRALGLGRERLAGAWRSGPNALRLATIY